MRGRPLRSAFAGPGLLPVVALVAALVPSSAVSGELPWTHFTPEGELVPLPSASVQTVYQDQEGYIWLGFFSSGLARYDGHGLDSYGMSDGLPDPTVREVVQDGAGHLWVATENGLAVSARPLQRYAPGERLSFLTRVDGVNLVESRIRMNWMVTGADGSVWVATPLHGVRSYRRGQDGTLETDVASVDLLSRGGPTPAAAIAARDDGSVWVSLENGAVGLIPPGGRRARPVPVHLEPGTWVTTFLEGRSGTVWLGCSDGRLVRLDPASPAGITDVSRHLSDQIQALLETSHGELWAGSLGTGALRIFLDGRAPPEHVTRRHGLPSETVWCITQDREENLWVGHNGGVSRLRPDFRAFTHYTGTSHTGEPPVLPEPATFSVLAPGDVRPLLWVGTGGGLAVVDPVDERSTTLTTADGLASDSVYSLERDRAGAVWIGTLSGLTVLGPPEALPTPHQPLARARRIDVLGTARSLRSYDVGTVYACRSLQMPTGADEPTQVESLWVCGTEGAWCWVGGRWLHFGPRSGLPSAGTTNAALDGDGHLWIGSQASGIYRSVEPFTLRRVLALPVQQDASRGSLVTVRVFSPYWNRRHGARSESVHNLLWSGTRMWAATSAGLAAVAGVPARTEVLLDHDSGLDGSRVMGLARDDRTATLWAAQNTGLAQVDPVTGEVLRRVSKQDGLLDNEVWVPSSLAVDSAGAVYMATPSGLSVYRPSMDARNLRPPEVRLREASISEDFGGHNEIVFRYAALSFSNEQSVRYRTRLAGFDTAWSDETTENKIRYTNLPAFLLPRDYVFEVQAANDDGVWSARPLQYTFTIHPPWWQRWWAVLGYLAVLAASVVAVGSARTTRLVDRTRELETVVAARTEELRAHAQEMEALDEIVATINRKLKLDEVMQALLEHGLILLRRSHQGVFLLRDDPKGPYRVTARTGTPVAEEPRQLDLPTTRDVVLGSARPAAEGILIGQIAAAADAPEWVLLTLRPGPHMVVDISTAGGLEGLLVFAPVPDVSEIDPGELQTLQRYRQHAISALDKARVVRALEQKSREAAQASHAKSAFLATMSHELRTPLNSIIGFSEVLLSKTDEQADPRAARFLGNIVASGKQLLSLINDILDLSKIEAGHMRLDLEETYVPELVEGVCRIMAGVVQRQKVHLVQRLEADVPPVVVDPSKTRQVLYNLLSNAVKFSPEGSEVVVSCRWIPAADCELGVDAVELAVQDHGIGIHSHDLDRIFDEFHQLDSTTSRRFVGTGLGLALVRRFVQLHGGRVSVTSRPGAGSTFSVVLPARPPSRA